MSYNGSGTFNINSTGQPVVAGTVISSSAFNALTTDLATGLTTAITKDGQTTTTARITFAQGITSSLVTDSSSTSTGSIITAGGVGIAKALYVGTTANVAGEASISGLTVGKGAGADSTSTAVGSGALATSGGSTNTAIGFYALNANSSGTANTSIGRNTLLANTSGGSNVAVGHQALTSNTTASNNTAVGYQAGYSNTTGERCAFFGYQAGNATTVNYAQTMLGFQAGLSTTGANNTFVGYLAGNTITTGAKNTILGSYSGNGGGLDIRTASNYIVLSDGDGNPRIYHNGSTLYITQMTSGAGSYAIKINASTGAITYDTSSARYKDNIRDSIYGLSHVMQMRSTQFEYKDDGRSDVGFIAEELDPIIPELVVKNKNGQPDAVSYDRMVSVLVKSIQELKTIVDVQAAEIAELKAKVGI